MAAPNTNSNAPSKRSRSPAHRRRNSSRSPRARSRSRSRDRSRSPRRRSRSPRRRSPHRTQRSPIVQPPRRNEVCKFYMSSLGCARGLVCEVRLLFLLLSKLADVSSSSCIQCLRLQCLRHHRAAVSLVEAHHAHVRSSSASEVRPGHEVQA